MCGSLVLQNQWMRTLLHALLRRIDVRKRSKPSILTIPSGKHLPVTIYQRYWTHRVVLPPLKHFSNVALTAPFSGRITTNLGRAKSWGKSKIFFCFWRFSRDKWIWYAEVYELLGSAVDMLFLPSFKIYSSSKKCTATCSWYYMYIYIWMYIPSVCTFLEVYKYKYYIYWYNIMGCQPKPFFQVLGLNDASFKYFSATTSTQNSRTPDTFPHS